MGISYSAVSRKDFLWLLESLPRHEGLPPPEGLHPPTSHSSSVSPCPRIPPHFIKHVCKISNKRYPHHNLCIKDGTEVVLASDNPYDPKQFWYRVPADGKGDGFALVNIDTMQAMVPAGKDKPVRLITVSKLSDGTMNPKFLHYSGDGILWTKDGISRFAGVMRVFNNPSLALDVEDERNAAGDARSSIRTCNCNDEEKQLWDLT